MPGQKRKGRNNKRKIKVKFELVQPNIDEGEIIAVVTATQGGYPPRFTCETIDGESFVAPIQGSIAKGPKRQFVKKGMYVLCVPMKCDSLTMNSNSLESKRMIIHHVYSDKDVRELDKKGFLKKVSDFKDDEIVFGANETEDDNKVVDFDIANI